VTARTSPRRIVSLVPSLTEALFVLGLGKHVVGVTEWCVHPAGEVAGVATVGGTKTPDLEKIQALHPDLVIANREENRRRDVLRLESAGLQVWVTYPRTVREGAALLREIAGLGASAPAFAEVVEPVEAALAEAERERLPSPVPVFCPIWRDPWMSVGAGTYAEDLLTLCGGRNIFSRPGARRYPHVRIDEVVAASPEVILLPDEPYAFGEADARELARLDVPAAHSRRIFPIDGTLVSWYGPRIRRAIETLRPIFAGAGGR
jgi:ABC-type Fe3+-hydroxamate transport system substrate-binding protein